MPTYFPGTKHKIETGETYFGELEKENISGRHNKVNGLNRGALPSRYGVAGGKPLEARIDHARFIVDCPNCGSAEYAFEDLWFYCTVCGNSDVDGKVKRVIFPPNRKEIEDTLAPRPIKNRNWNPGETIEVLEAENVAHGVD